MQKGKIIGTVAALVGVCAYMFGISTEYEFSWFVALAGWILGALGCALFVIIVFAGEEDEGDQETARMIKDAIERTSVSFEELEAEARRLSEALDRLHEKAISKECTKKEENPQKEQKNAR